MVLCFHGCDGNDVDMPIFQLVEKELIDQNCYNYMSSKNNDNLTGTTAFIISLILSEWIPLK